MAEHDEGSDGGLFLLWWIVKRHKLFYNTRQAWLLCRAITIFQVLHTLWKQQERDSVGVTQFSLVETDRLTACLFNPKIHTGTKIQ